DTRYSPAEAATAPPLGRCVIIAGRLSHLISAAYQLRSLNLLRGGPDWIMSGFDRYDISAKAEDASTATQDQLYAMLQSLLIERFDLKFHRESVDRSGFALVIGKNGARLTPAKGDQTSANFGPQFKPKRDEPVTLTARRYTMKMLATLLTNIDLQVVDKTG